MDKSSLAELGDKHLAEARTSAAGRSAETIFGGHASTLRQTVIALTAGQRLDEHENPGQATLQVLTGHVRMTAGGDTNDGTAGDLLIVPDTRHALEARTDSVVLLTVAKLP